VFFIRSSRRRPGPKLIDRPERGASGARSAWAPAFAGVSGILVALALGLMAPALAAPTFPALTGRVVDNANVLSPQVETDLTAKLENLDQSTGRQLVVVTVASLQGYEIEDYGYQLGRAWGIGEKGKNSGALLIVAPSERKVRIEVGYGLEPILTDALSSVIIQTTVLPRFKAGDLPGGIVAGADAVIQQLALPEDQARAKARQAFEVPAASEPSGGLGLIPIVLIGLVGLFLFSRLFRGRRGGRSSGLGQALPWIILNGLLSSGGRGGGGGWGGGSSGGGGFSGGGGSFGGGGSSGSW